MELVGEGGGAQTRRSLTKKKRLHFLDVDQKS